MTPSEAARAVLTYAGHADTEAVLDEVAWSAAERMARAAKALGLTWAAAAAAVFLPVLHFVLVPTLVLAGPVAALVRYRERRSLRGFDGVCPACGAALRERRALPVREETAIRCDGCGRGLTLRRISAARSPSPPRS